MKPLHIAILSLCIIIPAASHAQTLYKPLTFFLSVDAGYNHGLGLTLRGSLLQFTRKVPLGLELGAGYSHQFEPGNASAARKIFINDATGGTIEKYGYSLLVFLNLNYLLVHEKKFELFVKLGGRHNWYVAHFAFIGDNEVFDVKTDQWGIGLMAEARFALSKKVFLTLVAGIDYYFESRIYGHGTFYYTPDGVDQSTRNNYTYKDADAAINQPWLDFKATVGISYRM